MAQDYDMQSPTIRKAALKGDISGHGSEPGHLPRANTKAWALGSSNSASEGRIVYGSTHKSTMTTVLLSRNLPLFGTIPPSGYWYRHRAKSGQVLACCVPWCMEDWYSRSGMQAAWSGCMVLADIQSSAWPRSIWRTRDLTFPGRQRQAVMPRSGRAKSLPLGMLLIHRKISASQVSKWSVVKRR